MRKTSKGIKILAVVYVAVILAIIAATEKSRFLSI